MHSNFVPPPLHFTPSVRKSICEGARMTAKRPADPSWNCADPAQQLKEMFVDLVQTRRIKAGQSPAMRPVFLRLHGVAHARFEIAPDLADDLEVGVFAGQSYDAWVRFSSDTPSGPDLLTTIGIG